VIQWENRWPCRVDIRNDQYHHPFINVRQLVATLRALTPSPAVILLADHAEQITLDKSPAIEVAVRGQHRAIVADGEEAAVTLVEAAVADLVAEAGSTATRAARLALVAEKREQLRTAIAELRQSRAPMRVVFDREFETRALPEGAAGWWHNTPVFVFDEDVLIEG